MIADLVFALLQPQPASARVHLQAQTAQAQAQIAGECRQLQRLECIYTNADLGSPSVRDLPRAARVTLAGEVNQPSMGWILISSPAEGYILATFLAPCGSVPEFLLPQLPQPIRIPTFPAFIPPPLSSPPPFQLRLPRSPSPSPSPLPSLPNRPEP